MDGITSLIVMLLLQGIAAILFLLMINHMRLVGTIGTARETVPLREKVAVLVAYLGSISLLTMISLIIGLDSISGPIYGGSFALVASVLVALLVLGREYLDSEADTEQ